MFKGKEGALKILQALDPKSRDNILKILYEKDPLLAEELEKGLVKLEDLQYLTVKMLVELTKEIDLKDLGLALRIASQALKDFIFNNVSTTMKEDIESVLNGSPQPVSKVYQAHDKILEVVRKKIKAGEIIIDKSGSDPLV